jgi:hypothetical protein
VIRGAFILPDPTKKKYAKRMGMNDLPWRHIFPGRNRIEKRIRPST